MFVNATAIIDDCNDQTIYLDVTPDQNCVTDGFYDSQLVSLVVYPSGAVMPADWTDINEFFATIDNEATTNGVGRYLKGTGSKPINTKTVTAVRGHSFVSERIHTVSFEMRAMTTKNREFLRQLQYGRTNFTFYFQTKGLQMFGGPSGITPFFVDVDFPLDDNRTSVERGIITIQWYATVDPLRTSIGDLGPQIEIPIEDRTWLISAGFTWDVASGSWLLP